MALKKLVAIVLSLGIVISTSPVDVNAMPQESGENQQPAPMSSKDIDNLVAPIALYPDALVAQILGAATYPDQVAEADKFVKANAKLSASDLMAKVDTQPWDPSVKALSQFPSVLDNMAKNLSWTSALGQASYYQQKDVMASVQRLRKQAKDAGNLKSTSQQTVVQQDAQTIIIQPANPQVVYVPTYNPTVVYGTAYNPPGYSTAALVTTAVIAFTVGIAIGASMNNSWGWHSWGCGWHGGTVVYQRNVYVSRSNVYINNNRYYGSPRPTPYRNNTNINRSNNRNTNISGNTVNVNVNNGPANNANRRGGPSQPTTRDRGYGQKPNAGTKSSAFTGYGAGGNTRAQSNRGKSSYNSSNKGTSGRQGNKSRATAK